MWICANNFRSNSRYTINVGRSNGLGVNPSKKEHFLFTRKRKFDEFSPPMVDGITLNQLSRCCSPPKLEEDHHLNWKKNTEQHAKRGLITLYSRKELGRKPHIIKWI